LKIETSIEFMESLRWNPQNLEEAKINLEHWDKRPSSFYEGRPKYVMKVDLAEREHLRNCIKYWEKKLNDEN
jgi:hypothetical protein